MTIGQVGERCQTAVGPAAEHDSHEQRGAESKRHPGRAEFDYPDRTRGARIRRATASHAARHVTNAGCAHADKAEQYGKDKCRGLCRVILEYDR